ncbi:hypothetical protein HY385_03170 [Candidatus Daviesbacteria bacterium]|nr:hypothetical protein [Candidatus Daviesbacteria bacterium]
MIILGQTFRLKDVLSLVLIAALLLAIPLAVTLIKKQQIFKGKAASTFSVGFNTTGITHYGYNDLLPYAQSSNTDDILKEINRMGGKIIRLFVPNDRIGNEEAAKRLDLFLTKAASYNISVIATLVNFYGDNGFRPQGTAKYYTDNWQGIPLLADSFFNGGYKNEFLPFIQTVVSANKNHSNIYAWEVGNELKDNGSSTNFVNFMSDVTNYIKSIDPNHAIATGMLNAGHAALAPADLYPRLPNVDIVTIHPYNGSHDGLADVQWAMANSKKVIVEEAGFSGNGDRSNLMRAELDFWKSQGVTAVLHWGFLAKGLPDNGNGDGTYGMDTIWHTDYDALANLYASYNGTDYNDVTLTPSPTVTIVPTITSTLTPTLTTTPTPKTSPAILPTTPTPTIKKIITPTFTPTPPLSTTFPTLPPEQVQFDVNNDLKINSFDTGLFLEAWRSGQSYKAHDFNGDQIINSMDYSLMIKNLSQ